MTGHFHQDLAGRENHLKGMAEATGHTVDPVSRTAGASVFALHREGQSVAQAILDLQVDFVEFTHPMTFVRDTVPLISRLFHRISAICHQYGVYFLLDSGKGGLVLNLCSKLYFSGMDYYAFLEVLRDLSNCVEKIEDLFRDGRD